MPTRVTILGSTGSIGVNALDVIAHFGTEYEVVGLSAYRRCEELVAQAGRFGPKAVALADPQLERVARSRLAGLNGRVELLTGPEGLVKLVRETDADIVIAAIVGAAGLHATLEAVKLGKRVGIANKETLVVAGQLVMEAARRWNATLLPIDSEHSAIFQILQGRDRSEIRKIYLTASGGPFRTWSAEEIASATLDDSLRHPTWRMGPKVTIDSATMMNKALEIIEAHWLFGVDVDQIEIVVHPESIIHSMVEFCDGSLMAQLGSPDMRTPIQYALTWPRRVPGAGRSLDIRSMRRMNFEPPDFERFPALRLGYEVARRGGTAGAVFNAANEAAVQAFRDGVISFPQIVELTEDVLRRHDFVADPSLEELAAADGWARQEVAECLTC
jgi:1-deoxy-D-xylulose-5-phosphate reductoisomerase